MCHQMFFPAFPVDGGREGGKRKRIAERGEKEEGGNGFFGGGIFLLVAAACRLRGEKRAGEGEGSLKALSISSAARLKRKREKLLKEEKRRSLPFMSCGKGEKGQGRGGPRRKRRAHLVASSDAPLLLSLQGLGGGVPRRRDAVDRVQN